MRYLRFYYWVDTTVGALSTPPLCEGMIRRVVRVRVAALPWFHIFIIKKMYNVYLLSTLSFPPSGIGDHRRFRYPVVPFIWLSNHSILNVHNEGYCRSASWALNLISTFLLLSLCRYHCWWTISPRWYHPSSSQSFNSDMFYVIYSLWNLQFLNNVIFIKEELVDTKEIIRIRISKNRQYNGQKKKYKRTNNDLQNIHIKLKIE